MARKSETWTEITEALHEHRGLEYLTLTPREMAILCASVADIGVTHVLQKRLFGEQKRIDEFIGMKSRAVAPCGTFSSRINLASLVGATKEFETKALHAIRDIRNAFAHNVQVTLLDADVSSKLEVLHEFVTKLMLARGKKLKAHDNKIIAYLDRYKSDVEAAKYVLDLATVWIQKMLSARLKTVTPIVPL